MQIKTIYIKEFDCFGMQIELNITCDNWNALLSALSSDTLKSLLNTSINNENYKMSEIINKHIKYKS